MNEQDFELLNNYFNGLLSAEDAGAVRARTATDGEFAREFALREQMEAFPQRDVRRRALAGNLASVGADFFLEKEGETTERPALTASKVNWRRWVAAAASVLLVAVAAWFLAVPTRPDYGQYAQHEPLSLTLRGVADQAASTAEADFNAKNYAGALTALEQLLKEQPGNLTGRLYQGICLIELGRGAEARAVLTPMADGNTALKGEAIWYVALSYLKDKDTAGCRAALLRLREGDDHYEQAQQLLKKLK